MHMIKRHAKKIVAGIAVLLVAILIYCSDEDAERCQELINQARLQQDTPDEIRLYEEALACAAPGQDISLASLLASLYIREGRTEDLKLLLEREKDLFTASPMRKLCYAILNGISGDKNTETQYINEILNIRPEHKTSFFDHLITGGGSKYGYYSTLYDGYDSWFSDLLALYHAHYHVFAQLMRENEYEKAIQHCKKFFFLPAIQEEDVINYLNFVGECQMNGVNSLFFSKNGYYIEEQAATMSYAIPWLSRPNGSGSSLEEVCRIRYEIIGIYLEALDDLLGEEETRRFVSECRSILDKEPGGIFRLPLFFYTNIPNMPSPDEARALFKCGKKEEFTPVIKLQPLNVISPAHQAGLRVPAVLLQADSYNMWDQQLTEIKYFGCIKSCLEVSSFTILNLPDIYVPAFGEKNNPSGISYTIIWLPKHYVDMMRYLFDNHKKIRSE